MIDLTAGQERDTKAMRARHLFSNTGRPGAIDELRNLVAELDVLGEFDFDAEMERRRQLMERFSEIHRAASERREAWWAEQGKEVAQGGPKWHDPSNNYDPYTNGDDNAELKRIAAEGADYGRRVDRLLNPEAWAAYDRVRASRPGEDIGMFHLYPRRGRLIEVTFEDGEPVVDDAVVWGQAHGVGFITSKSPQELPRFQAVIEFSNGLKTVVRRSNLLSPIPSQGIRQWESLGDYLAYAKRRHSRKYQLTALTVREELQLYARQYGQPAARRILAGVGLRSLNEMRQEHYQAIFDACDQPPVEDDDAA